MQLIKHRYIVFFIVVLALFLILLGAFSLTGSSKISSGAINSIAPTAVNIKPTTSSSSVITGGICQGNVLSKELIVIISQQHLWACQYNQLVFNTPVVTGDENYVADTTPVGTYKIYNKQTNLNLTGSDQMGSWNVHVDYWMAFLSNQYGIFGVHDAQWVPNSDFGKIPPDTLQSSHGCVELPLSAEAWVYNWSPIGTTLVIKA
jgi:uncharacterized membrane protein